MKFLLLLVLLAVAWLLWRSARRRRDDRPAAPPARPPAPAAGSPRDMVRCPVCSVHLPRGDAVAGAGGVLYCSPEHRLIGGG